MTDSLLPLVMDMSLALFSLLRMGEEEHYFPTSQERNPFNRGAVVTLLVCTAKERIPPPKKAHKPKPDLH